MPYTTFSDGSVLTASQVNTNFRDQVISTVTSGTRPSGTEGQMIYETDTDLCYIYNGGWVRFGAGGAWTSYTPTLTQSSAVTKTVAYAKYEKIGRLVICQATLNVTGTGAANNTITVSLPFTAAAGANECGSGHIYDASAGQNSPGTCYLNSTTTISLIDTTQITTGAFLGQTGTAMSAALASSDAVQVFFTYEAAS